MKTNTLLFAALILIGISCEKGDSISIESEFQEYVDRFFNEASLRGLDLDSTNLEVVFGDINSGCGLGYSNFNGTGLRRVEIDEDC